MTSDAINISANVVRRQPQDNRVLPQNGNVLPTQGSNLPGEQTNSGEPPKVQDLNKITERLNEFFQAKQHGLEFSLDDASGRTIIRVIDKETNEVIRQFPADEILSISEMIQENVQENLEKNVGVLLEAES